MASFLARLTPAAFFPVILVLLLLAFFAQYWAGLRRAVPLEPPVPRPRFSFAGKCHPMKLLDWVLMLALTAAYACTAFFQLGSRVSPQEFRDFSDGQTVTIELSGEPITAYGIRTFSGLGTGAYDVECSEDGLTWYTLSAREDAKMERYWAKSRPAQPAFALDQPYSKLFRWLDFEIADPLPVQFLRITGKADKSILELARLCLLNAEGQPVPFEATLEDGSPLPDDLAALFSVDETVPEKSSWFNSTYFDEIYHARTAKEHLDGVEPYEVSHPPLGKIIMGLGIHFFGMTPFGWRFMGTLFGVLMLPLLYLFIQNLFGKTLVSLCGTALFAFDFMHLTQTRIATIDTYGVFFILAMYYFLYRYLVLPAGTSFKKGAPWLLLSGLMWGIGAASKWTVIYGAVGLAVVYFLGLWFKLRDWPRELNELEPTRLGPPSVPIQPWLWKTLAFSVLCFVLIPAAIYTLSYLPYAKAYGDTSPAGLVKAMWDNQVFMLTYHQGVTAPHPYSSRWYQWVLDLRPILYYLDTELAPGMKSAFGAFSNPVVCWGGLLALLTLIVQLPRRCCGKALFLVIAYFSQLAPWFLIGRTTFEYHYFPSILFLCIIIAYVFNDMIELNIRGAKCQILIFTGAAVALFALFYPVLIGLPVSESYCWHLLRWFPSWPF